MLIPAPKLESFAAALLLAGGFTKDEAALTAKSLILSNLMGHDSHGVVRVRQYNEELASGKLKSGIDLHILNESNNSIHADAGCGLGQVQMPRLLKSLFDKSNQCAVVTGALVNCGHVGRLGEWVELAALKNLAAFMAVNDNGVYQCVAPFGGIEARTSTNPIAFSIPLKNNDHFAIDLSTSATAMGKVHLANITGQQVPEGQIQDHEGNPTTSPAHLYNEPKGSVLPFGGYKGFALSMMVDCLAAGLTGGHTPPPPANASSTNNVVITLWNPKFFAGLSHLHDEAEKYIAHIHATKPKDPAHPVRIPGDRAKKTMAQRQKDGIPLDDGFCEKLEKYAQSLGITSSPFPAR